MLRNSSRTWAGATAALLALVVAAAWLLLISPLRAEAARQHEEAAGVQVTNDLVRTRTAELERQYAGLPAEQAELAALQAAMPADADPAGLVRGLQPLADSAGVTLMAITPGPAVLPTGTAAGAAAAGAAGTGAAATGGSVTVRVPVVVEVVGPFAKAELFLRGVQTQLPRAFLVEQLDVVAEKPGAAEGGEPATVNGDVTLTVTGSVFVLRDAADLNAAAAAGTAGVPAPAATPAPAAGPVSAADPTTPAA